MDKEVLKKSIRELHLELSGAQARVSSIQSAIFGLRKECAHEWKYHGHGHNYDVYKCSICDESEHR